MSDNVGVLQQELRNARDGQFSILVSCFVSHKFCFLFYVAVRAKDKELRILNEKLRIAEEIIGLSNFLLLF